MKSRKGGNPFLPIRAAHDKFGETEGKKVEFKIAALVNKDVMTSQLSTPTILRKLKRKFSTISGHSKVSEVLEFSAAGSPLKIQTPGRTILARHKRLGVIDTFTNLPVDPKAEAKLALPPQSQFHRSASCLAIKPPAENKKEITILITPELLKKSAGERRRNNNRRVCSQNKVMVKVGKSEKEGSATNYAQATELFSEELMFEWLHLANYKVLGSQAQEEKNLVGGTDHANTDMIPFEDQLSRLTKLFPQGFSLYVEAEMVDQTQIASVIRFRIETEVFAYTAEFNAQTPTRPHIKNKEFIDSMTAALTEAATPDVNQAKKEQSTPSMIFRPKKPKKLFDAPEKEPQAAETQTQAQAMTISS